MSVQQTLSLNKRNQIQTGDLLAWGHGTNDNENTFSQKFIRFMTASDFAHVSIAYKTETGLQHIEATTPAIRKRYINDNECFYHLPMFLSLEPSQLIWLDKKIGLKYSRWDAVRAYLGLNTNSDKRWQCAELANKFYKHIGLDFGLNYTPSSLINQILLKTNSCLVKIPPC